MAAVTSTSLAQSSTAAMAACPMAAAAPMSTVSPAACSPTRYGELLLVLHLLYFFCLHFTRSIRIFLWDSSGNRREPCRCQKWLLWGSLCLQGKEVVPSSSSGSLAEWAIVFLIRYLKNKTSALLLTWAPLSLSFPSSSPYQQSVSLGEISKVTLCFWVWNLLQVLTFVSIATSPGALPQPGSCGIPEPLHGSRRSLWIVFG